MLLTIINNKYMNIHHCFCIPLPIWWEKREQRMCVHLMFSFLQSLALLIKSHTTAPCVTEAHLCRKTLIKTPLGGLQSLWEDPRVRLGGCTMRNNIPGTAYTTDTGQDTRVTDPPSSTITPGLPPNWALPSTGSLLVLTCNPALPEITWMTVCKPLGNHLLQLQGSWLA